MNKLGALLLAALFIIQLTPIAIARAQARPSTLAVISDILVLRPLGFAGTVVGTTAFVVSLPVTLSFHKTHLAQKLLVGKPFRYTFERLPGKM